VIKKICARFTLFIIVTSVGWNSLAAPARLPATERALRVAIIGFVDGSVAGEKSNSEKSDSEKSNSEKSGSALRLEDALESAFKRDARVALIEPSQLKPALAGTGYNRSINMSRDEARGLGAAIGCDFFIIGKKDLATRSEAKGESHEEAVLGLMIVDGRTGALAAFDFLIEKASAREAALAALMKAVDSRAANYIEWMNQIRARRETLSPPAARSSEIIEDIRNAEPAAGADFKPPEFLNRAKPEYTEAAERADINATVEAAAVFRASGEVGEVEITRWAGFGLDESAERAIRSLKFKPAMRAGQPVSVRAMVRYNFRRVEDQPRKSDAPAAAPPPAPVPDLRKYFKPGYRPPA
jgi:TonB family protein